MSTDETAARKAESPDQPVTVAGKKLVLRFSIRAMMALKDFWGLVDDDDLSADGALSADDKVQLKLGKPSMDDFVTIFWAATRSKHPELTREDVLELLDEGGLEGLQQVLANVTSAAAPRGSKKKAPTPSR